MIIGCCRSIRSSFVTRGKERVYGLWPKASAPLLALLLLNQGCAAPAPRLESYLGPSPSQERQASQDSARLSGLPQEAGVIVINDTSVPGSAPALVQETRSVFTDRAKQWTEQAIPVRVVAILANGAAIKADRPLQSLTELAAEQRLSHLLLVILSSAESEVPVRLSLGGPESTSVPGSEVNNYALVELALLEVQNGKSLVRAQGRGWATLETLARAGRSHRYPIIFPSGRATAVAAGDLEPRDALRLTAGLEALEQALVQLRARWASLKAS